MRRVLVCVLSGLAAGLTLANLALSVAVRASGPDPDDYPLRVHILHAISQAPDARESRKYPGMTDYVEGDGHADLFEHGEPRGFGFHNNCQVKLQVNGEYSTLPARWKKPDKTLEILVPEPGKPWNMVGCDLQVVMRPGLAYFWTEDSVVEQAAATVKDWMVKHQYDPEKGQDLPIDPPAGTDGAGGAGTSSSNPGGKPDVSR